MEAEVLQNAYMEMRARVAALSDDDICIAATVQQCACVADRRHRCNPQLRPVPLLFCNGFYNHADVFKYFINKHVLTFKLLHGLPISPVREDSAGFYIVQLMSSVHKLTYGCQQLVKLCCSNHAGVFSASTGFH